jgi:hypothetical protein
MGATTRGTPLAGPDVIINSVDAYQIRLAVTGTSCDKYPGEPRFLRMEPGVIPKGSNMPPDDLPTSLRPTTGSQPVIMPTPS